MKRTEQTDNDGNSSFISDVLDFVSRELNHFVANATGVAVAVEPLASSRGQNQPRRPSKLQNRRLNPTDNLTQSLSLDGLQPHDFATQVAHESKIAPMPHSIMPGTFLPSSPTLEPNNLPDLHITTSMKPLLHDEPDGKDEGMRDIVASHQTHQNSALRDDDLPSAAIAPCDIPTSSKSTKDDKKTIASSAGSLWLEQTRSHDCIDIISPRPVTWESPKRNDTSAEQVGFLQEQESGRREMQERLRDKEKIQYLEEEIRKLKELLKKDIDKSIFLPPPAPPPPPARAVSTRIPASSKISDPSLLITSARASLKRAPTPVEAPINPRIPTKRQGLPAVGVPPDKMAAFLSELKNVRLRKVGSNSKHALAAPNLSNDISFASYSNLSFDGGSTTFDKSSTKSFTFDFVDPNLVETGAKRKRELYDDGSDCVLPDKMHMVSAVHTRRTTGGRPSPRMDVTTPHLWDNAGPNSRTWPSNFANENTTPSLTSDNDRERDDVSPHERTPETPPPDILHHIREPKEVPEANAYIQCRDMPSVNGSPSSQAVPSQAFGMEDIFSRRVPTSPLPPKTHRKPYPPSKARRSPRNTSVISVNNPQSVTSARASAGQPPQEQIVEPPPRRDLREIAASHPFPHYSKKGRSRSQRKQQHSRPRGTLDQELRRAVKSLESIATENPPDYEECDVFIGVGFHEKSTNCRPCDGSTHNTMHAENKLSQANPVTSKQPASTTVLDGS